jgi:hypothetical protein
MFAGHHSVFIHLSIFSYKSKLLFNNSVRFLHQVIKWFTFLTVLFGIIENGAKSTFAKNNLLPDEETVLLTFSIFEKSFFIKVRFV